MAAIMNAICYLVLMATLLELHLTTGKKKDKNLYCSVCRSLVEEVDARIKDIDPNKKVKVGSFRVGPDGNQQLFEKQYARSEVHLTDVFENVCDAFKDYAMTQSTGSERKMGVTRIRTRSGEELDTKNVGFSENLKQTFISYCQAVIEDHEDEMFGLFKQKDATVESIEAELCGKMADTCSTEDLSQPLERLPKRTESKPSSFHQLEPEEGPPGDRDNLVDDYQHLDDKVIPPQDPDPKVEL